MSFTIKQSPFKQSPEVTAKRRQFNTCKFMRSNNAGMQWVQGQLADELSAEKARIRATITAAHDAAFKAFSWELGTFKVWNSFNTGDSESDQQKEKEWMLAAANESIRFLEQCKEKNTLLTDIAVTKYWRFIHRLAARKDRVLLRAAFKLQTALLNVSAGAN